VLVVPPAQRLDAPGDLALAGEQPVQVALAAREQAGHLVVPGDGVAQLGLAGRHGAQDGVALLELGLLGQVAHPGVAPEGQGAPLVPVDAGDDAEQRALAGAVDADEAHLLALVHREGDAVEDDARAEALVQVLHGDYWSSHRPGISKRSGNRARTHRRGSACRAESWRRSG
jgi:hypothetical protein